MKKNIARAHVGRPPFAYEGSLGKLVDKLGGGMEGAEAVAARAGVTQKTLQRYGAGRLVPSRAVRALLRALAKEHRVADPFPESAVAA